MFAFYYNDGNNVRTTLYPLAYQCMYVVLSYCVMYGWLIAMRQLNNGLLDCFNTVIQ